MIWSTSSATALSSAGCPYPAPMTIAHEEPWTLRHILEEIGHAKGVRISFVPVPWRPAWAVIKAAELLGLRLPFRSDSLISLMYQNPAPSFAPLADSNIKCRSFRLEPALRSGPVPAVAATTSSSQARS